MTTVSRSRPLARPSPILQARRSPCSSSEQPRALCSHPTLSLWVPQELSSPGPFCIGGRYLGGPCPGASGYSSYLDSSSSEQNLDLFHSNGWASRSRCVHGAQLPVASWVAREWRSHCVRGKVGGEGLGPGWLVGGGPQTRGSAGGWAVQLLLPSVPAPPAWTAVL